MGCIDEAIKRGVDRAFEKPHENLGGRSFKQLLKEFHSGEIAPVVHGRFVGTEYDGFADGNPVYYEWQCSECGCVFEDDEPTYNYCPHCGAKMDAPACGEDYCEI